MSGDDSCFCRLCEPPYETSLAMIQQHLVDEHGFDAAELAVAIADADVVVTDREPTDDEIYNRPGVEGGIGYTHDAPGSLGENDWRL